MGSEAQIAEAITDMQKYIRDTNCGRPTHLTMNVEHARTLYFEFNPNDTEIDFQQWLSSLPEEE